MSASGQVLPHAPAEPAANAERLFAAVALLFSTGAFLNLGIVPGEVPSGAAGVVSLPVTGLIYLITLFLLIRHCKGFVTVFLREWPLVALAGIAMASALWSQVPATSFRHGVGLLFTFLFGTYLAMRYSLRDQLRLLAWALGICVVFSYVFSLLGLGTSVDAGLGVSGWYGVFGQKNGLGEMMVLSALVFLFWKRAEPEHKWLANAGFFGSIVLIVLSRSMTSVLVFGLLMILLPYLRWAARKSTGWMVAGIVLLAGVGTASLLYVVTHLPELTGLLGKSATLTGRIQIWIVSTVMALRRPWLGYGYNAFWLPDKWYVQRIWTLLGWRVPHAHNGFLELWLELGLCGLGVFLVGFIVYVWRALRFLVERVGPEATWPLAFLAFIFLLNITEVTLLDRNSIFVVVYTVVAVSTSPHLLRARSPAVASVRIQESPSAA